MDKQELAHLLSDDSQKLKRLYDTYRTPFLNQGRQYGLADEVLAEVYKEAFVTMYKRGVKGKLHKVSNSVHDYLLGIGKFMIIDLLKSGFPEALEQAYKKNSSSFSIRQKEIKEAYQRSAPECRKLLKLFYYRGMSFKKVASLLAFNDDSEVVKNIETCFKSWNFNVKFSTDKSLQLLIQKYLKRKLSDKEHADVELQLKGDLKFKREVAFLTDLHTVIEAESEEQLRHILSEFEISYMPYKKSRRLLWYVATSILVLLGMAYFFTIMQPASTENLYADYFSPYKNVVHPVIEGVQVLDQKTKAFSTYENRDYKEAITRFKALYNQTGDAYYLFYQANAHMANNEVEEAITLLQKHLEAGDALQKKTHWYLALAYLKLKNKEQAKHFLELTIKEEGYNYEQAKEILATLE